jgi:hypothetical protein
MAWSQSQVFVAWIQATQGQGQTAQVLPAAYAGLGADTINVPLFSAGTPDNTVARTLTGYATGQYVVGNQTGATDANWAAAGRPLASKTTNTATNVFTFDAADLSGAGNVTLSGVVGCQVYDDTITVGTGGIADQGVCFNYFGGAQSVTAGTFTIVWNASGIFTVTCT